MGSKAGSLVALLFLCLSLSFVFTVSTTDSENDAEIMKRLASLISPTPLGWNLSHHPCNWSHIVCHSSLRVSEINLSDRNISGTLPSDLNSLSQLTSLSFDHNHLTGSLPSFANLRFLQFIWLDSNNFTSIPNDAFTDLTSLKMLSIRNNHELRSWAIPTQLVNSKNLTYIVARSTNLGGSIPDIFNSLLHLKQLDLSFNNLSGLLPSSFRQSSIVYLWLSNQTDGLYGTLDVLSNMTSLQWVMLDGNKFTGPIPASLIRFPQLTTLDVSNNNISPPLPHFNSNVSLKISGNSLLSVTTPTESSHGKNSPKTKASIKITLLILFGSLLALIFVVLIFVLVYKKRKHQPSEAHDLENSQQLLPDNPVRFTYEVLKAATNNFDKQRTLGTGGFGSVFEGTLSDGTRVAVKKLDRVSQGMKEFLAEVRTIGSVHHLNLAKLIGFCADKTCKLLVYEYMINGSLDKWIFHENFRSSLDWETRKKIILDIAMGLAYLHEECKKRIAHLDVKPQNVLLDEKFNAKLSDFGLAKLIDRDQSHVMTQMRGTRGYLAPEWLDRKITEKADVYSYGVLALEVVFERKNLDATPPEESDNRLIYIVRKKVDASQLSELLNNCSEDMQENREEVEKIIKLALWCLHLDPKIRPSMSMVVNILEGAMSMDFINDHVLLSSPMDGNATRDSTTQVSDSILSGPR